MGRRDDGFNSPFADLPKRMKEKQRAEREAKKEEAARQAAAEKSSRSEGRQTAGPQGTADDDTLFRRWMGDVVPLEEQGPRRIAPSRRRSPPAGTSAFDEDAEVLAALSDLVGGEGSFEISDTDEYVEGVAPGIDRRLLRRLKRGDFSVQGHLDLHGMVKDEAREAVERFVRSSRHAGRRCVIIVHGRGLRSPGGEPVLKKALVKWLSRGSLGKQVLAFCTTLAHDGGGGAVYVLLRR